MRPVTKVNPSRSLVKSSRMDMLGASGDLVLPSVCRLREGQCLSMDDEPSEVERELGVKGSGRMESPEWNSRDLYSSWFNPPRNQRYKAVRRNPKEREIEKSEEAVVSTMMRTTQPHRREGPLLLSCFRGTRYCAIAKC